MNTIRIYFDGGAHLRLKTAYGSYEVVGEGCNHRVDRMAHPACSCNQAEYLTMIAALRWLTHNCPNYAERLEIFSDSKLVVEQMNGRWKIKVIHIRELVDEANYLLKKLGFSLNLFWQPRRFNVARFGH